MFKRSRRVLVLLQMICWLRKIPLLRRLSGLWAGNQGRSRAGDAAPSKYPASVLSSARLSQRCSRQWKAAEFRTTGMVKFICKIQKKKFYLKTWEINTTSLFIHPNNKAQKVMWIYVVLHCTLNYIHVTF